MANRRCSAAWESASNSGSDLPCFFLRVAFPVDRMEKVRRWSSAPPTDAALNTDRAGVATSPSPGGTSTVRSCCLIAPTGQSILATQQHRHTDAAGRLFVRMQTTASIHVNFFSPLLKTYAVQIYGVLQFQRSKLCNKCIVYSCV
jgi:hypothetical protein